MGSELRFGNLQTAAGAHAERMQRMTLRYGLDLSIRP